MPLWNGGHRPRQANCTETGNAGVSNTGAAARAFLEYYRCPAQFAAFRVADGVNRLDSGFFRFGPDLVLYGCATVPCARFADEFLSDATPNIRHDEVGFVLPFNPTEVAD